MSREDIAEPSPAVEKEIALHMKAVTFEFLLDEAFHRGQMRLSAKGVSFADNYFQVAA